MFERYEAEVQRCVSQLERTSALCPAALVRRRGAAERERLVTVVVPMFDSSRFVDDCLKGLLAQTHAELEIICVDDHSSDDTYDRAVGHFGQDYRVSVVRLGRRVGPHQI